MVSFIGFRIVLNLIFHRSIFLSFSYEGQDCYFICFETEPFLLCLWTIFNWRILLQIIIFQTKIFQIPLTGKINWNSKVKRRIYQRSSLSWLLYWDKNASTFCCGGKPFGYDFVISEFFYPISIRWSRPHKVCHFGGNIPQTLLRYRKNVFLFYCQIDF